MSSLFSLLSSFFSSMFFLPLLNTPPLFPATHHHGASDHHLSNKIHNIYHLFLLYLILKFIFWLEIFSEFSNAVFVVRSRPPQIVFRQITTIKILSFVFPTKSTKKNHVWMSLLRRPLHRKTSPPCRKILFNVCLRQPRRVFEQKSETMLLFFFNLSNGSVKRVSDLWLLVSCCLCVFSQKKMIFLCCVERRRVKECWLLCAMIIEKMKREFGFFFIMEYKRVDVSRR